MALYEFQLLEGDELAVMPFAVDFKSSEEAIAHAIGATQVIMDSGTVWTRLLLLENGRLEFVQYPATPGVGRDPTPGSG